MHPSESTGTQVEPRTGTPLVSILVPCYRGGNYLRQALDSCLAQTYTNIEVLGVDDQSPDDTWAIFEEYAARDPRVRIFLRQKNGGQGRAFQTGLENSRGEYVTRLAHDDIFYPDAVKTLATALREHPDVALVYGDMVQIDENGKVLYPMITEPPERALLPRNRVGLYTMWRKVVHQKVGQFVTDSSAEDYDLWLQISLHYKLLKVNAPPQLGFRFHATQASQNHAGITRSTMRAHLRYNQALARRQPYSVGIRFKLLKGYIRYLLHEIGFGRVKPGQRA